MPCVCIAGSRIRHHFGLAQEIGNRAAGWISPRGRIWGQHSLRPSPKSTGTTLHFLPHRGTLRRAGRPGLRTSPLWPLPAPRIPRALICLSNPRRPHFSGRIGTLTRYCSAAANQNQTQYDAAPGTQHHHRSLSNADQQQRGECCRTTSARLDQSYDTAKSL